MTQMLSVETATVVATIHPDFPIPTKEQIEQRVKEVLAVQNYLHTDKIGKQEEISLAHMFRKKGTQPRESRRDDNALGAGR